MRARAWLLNLLAAVACNAAPSTTGFVGGPGGGPVASGASETGSGSSSAAQASSTTGSAEDSAGSGASADSTTLSLDVGVMPDVGNPQPVGCKGKIDVLFVVSRYSNMQYKQANMSKQFPKLIGAIADRFDEFDYHIMAVDGDDTWGLELCNNNCTPEACPVEDYPCELLDTITECDDTLGAGTVFNAGGFAYNKPCSLAGGNRYIVKGQPEIEETFTCLVSMGASGGSLLLEAMSAALSPELNGPGGCNEGFLRDDALLLVVFLTDVYDETSDGDHWDWAKAVREAKGGDLESVVFLYFGWFCVNPNKDRVCQLREHFPYWVLADVDATDYGPAMNEAADLVSTACSSFIPQ